jgi:uncharacterized damage-inducible protein DinB
MSTDPRYPLGRFAPPESYTPALRESFLTDIEQLPLLLRRAVEGLTEEQMNTPYREGGWTLRQVVHHVADSHLHSYIRCKFAKSMENPTIMPYDEQVWATFEDASQEPVEVSLTLLASLHRRWARWLRSLAPADFDCTLMHPENGPMTLDKVLALYSWHGRHHTAHITGLRGRRGW